MSKILTYSLMLVAVLAFQFSAGYTPHAPLYSNYPISQMRSKIHLKWMAVSLFVSMFITSQLIYSI